MGMQLETESQNDVAEDLRTFVRTRRFGTILADPPWQFQNRTGKIKRGIQDAKSRGEREHLESAYKAGIEAIIGLEDRRAERMVQYVVALSREGIIVNDGGEKLEAKHFFRREVAGFKMDLEDSFPGANTSNAVRIAEAVLSDFSSVKAVSSNGGPFKGESNGTQGTSKNPELRIRPGADEWESVGDYVDRDGEEWFDAEDK